MLRNLTHLHFRLKTAICRLRSIACVDIDPTKAGMPGGTATDAILPQGDMGDH
jgi:hypothetical protein